MTLANEARPGTSRLLTHEQMRELVDRHTAAENAKDVDGAVAVYTDDVEHDTAGAPTGVLRGKDGARGFYEMLTSNVTCRSMTVLREYFSDDACTLEHQWTGTVDGELLGIPGNGKEISFRMLHVFEFRDGLISRENVWLDGATIAAQLTGGAH